MYDQSRILAPNCWLCRVRRCNKRIMQFKDSQTLTIRFRKWCTIEQYKPTLPAMRSSQLPIRRRGQIDWAHARGAPTIRLLPVDYRRNRRSDSTSRGRSRDFWAARRFQLQRAEEGRHGAVKSMVGDSRRLEPRGRGEETKLVMERHCVCFHWKGL